MKGGLEAWVPYPSQPGVVQAEVRAGRAGLPGGAAAVWSSPACLCQQPNPPSCLSRAGGNEERVGGEARQKEHCR